MTDEMILVPRAELLAWAQDWLRENDPGDGTDCVTPFDWHLLKTPVKAHCTTCSCVPGMTPAVRFDTTPAEREGAVRDHLVRMGWTPPAEAQAQGGGECCHSWEDYGQMNVVRCNKCEARAVNGYEDRPFTAPPSAATPLSREHGSVQEMFNPSASVGAAEEMVLDAIERRGSSVPVGVEAVVADMRRWVRQVEASGPYAAGRTVVVQEWANQLEALAQQPPAEAQPVAWIMKDKDSGDYWPESFALGSEPTEDEPDDAEWVPLFLGQPPSAPVGVEAVFSLIRACESAVRRLGWRSNDYSLGHEARMLAQGYENGAFQSARETLRALAQQPPAEAQPEPNWCRTCGRRPHDPVAALCPDTHHRKASPPSAPMGVEGGLLERLDAIHRQVFGKPYPTEALAQQSSVAPVGVPVDVVREYLDARACYDPALRHPNSPEGLRLREARNALDAAIALAQQPAPSAPVGVDEPSLMARLDAIHRQVFGKPYPAPVGVEVKVLARDVHYAIRDAGLAPESPADDAAMRDAILRTLAQQPAADRVCPNTLQACRCDKYTPCAAQQPAACAHSWHDYGKVNRAWCSRCNAVAVIGHEDRPYGVLSVTDDGEYRTDPTQQPEADGEMAELVGLLDEVRSHFTRDDDLPDDLLPRIDAALAAQPGGVGNE